MTIKSKNGQLNEDRVKRMMMKLSFKDISDILGFLLNAEEKKKESEE